MGERQQQMLHSVLVLQHEAMKSLTREFYQQVEAFVALTGQHPLTQEPLGSASAASAAAAADQQNGASTEPVALRSAPHGTANLISDAIARLTKDMCDQHMCVRNTAQMTEFLRRVPEAVKTDDDRVQVLFVLDLTLQRARKNRSSSSTSSSNSNSANGGSAASADAGRTMIRHFETIHGYNMFADWFAEACTYHDEPKRRLTQLVLQVLLRNKPKLQFTKGMVMQKLRRTQTFVSGKGNKELVTQVLEKYREDSQHQEHQPASPPPNEVALHSHSFKLQQLPSAMDGFLDYLPAASGLLHKKTWTRRFFRLNTAFHVLEFFGDASMQERKGKLDLQNAQVVTADELGGLLFKGNGEQCKAQLSTKISIENSRRFVIRVSEYDTAKKTFAHHFLCAELADEGPQASRKYMQQWLQALQRVAQSCTPTRNGEDSAAIAPLGPRELSCKIAAYMDHMHLAACISGRELENKKSVFEITIKAWILQRELIADDDDNGDAENGEAQSSSSWQILEYACAWKVRKTTAQLRDFDTQLRQFFQRELRDVVFPSSSSSHSLLHSAAHVEVETQRRVALTNTYLHQLLCLPAFSAFGSDGSIMLDNFLEISPHFASFRQIEKASGQNLQLRKRKIVSWSERLQFEQLYKMHVDAAQAQVDKPHQRRHTSAQSGRRQSSKTDDRRHSQQPSSHHHEHREHRHHHRSSKLDQIADDECDTSPVPVATRQPSIVEERPQGETVQERIAKIGKKLITEAFLSPTLHS